MKKLYSVYDSVADFWQAPQMASNDNDAMRGFILSCSNPAIPSQFLGDISLHQIGEFDELDGFISRCDPRLIIRGNDFLIKQARGGFNKEDSNEISEEEN